VTDPVSDVSGLSTDIVANLTVYNISYEAFSPFTAAYDEVRSVEVAFFLKSTFSVPSLLIPPPFFFSSYVSTFIPVPQLLPTLTLSISFLSILLLLFQTGTPSSELKA
jgi:hypothetical protein